MHRFLTLVLIGLAYASVASADHHGGFEAPEVDPASGTAALALGAGVVLLFRGRRKRSPEPR